MIGRFTRLLDGGRLARSATLALVAAVALGSVSYAGDTPQARKACIASVFRLCPLAAIAGDHEGAKSCLLKKLDRASPECQAAVRGNVATEDTPPRQHG